MLLSQLLKVSGFALIEKTSELNNDPDITGICPDSKRIARGNLYVAIEGLHTDGHAYIDDAVRQGASAVVVSDSALSDGRIQTEKMTVPVIAAEDPRAASARLFAAWYGEPQKKMKIVGVTGTNGKTSISSLIYEILNRSGVKVGLIGTLGCLSPKGKIDIKSHDSNANMTTPDPEELYAILDIMANDGAEVVVMEITSHALSLGKVEPILFDIGIFTNLTEDHLDLHGDMENYFSAKTKLFDMCRRAVINIDDRYGRRLAESINIPLFTCSAEGRRATCCAEDIRQKGISGIEYKLTSPKLRLRVRTPLQGTFNVMNTMQAAVSAHLLGASVRDIQSSLLDFSGVEGRLEKLKLPREVDFSVFIDYAHTPDALENLLRTARAFSNRGRRLVLLFGCGGDRDRQKRPIMGRIATSLADFVIITSDNSRGEKTSDIICDILEGVCPDACFTVIENRRDAIEYAIKNARRGDIILLAGKGHERYEIGAMGRLPFCERDIVYAAIEKYC